MRLCAPAVEHQETQRRTIADWLVPLLNGHDWRHKVAESADGDGVTKYGCANHDGKTTVALRDMANRRCLFRRCGGMTAGCGSTGKQPPRGSCLAIYWAFRLEVLLLVDIHVINVAAKLALGDFSCFGS
jgi:hypothetical protein